MDIKKLLLGTLAGGFTSFMLGWLFYGILLMDFFQSHAGSATGVAKNPPEFLWLIIGQLVFGFLITYIFLKWAGIRTFVSGAKAGALIGFLIGLGINCIFYATTNITDLTACFTDSIVQLVMMGISGGVIGWVLGMGDD